MEDDGRNLASYEDEASNLRAALYKIVEIIEQAGGGRLPLVAQIKEVATEALEA